MKVWVTRPECGEVYMGGLRSVRLWTELPFFDQCAFRPDFELYTPDGKEFVALVCMEGGWTAESGSVNAKNLLKQDPVLLEKVWRLIYQSVMPKDVSDPLNYEMSETEYAVLVDESPDYEMVCMTHWKRLLIEVDLRAATAHTIEPYVLMKNDATTIKTPVTGNVGTTSLFIDGDLEKPFYYHHWKNYDYRRDRIF